MFAEAQKSIRAMYLGRPRFRGETFEWELERVWKNGGKWGKSFALGDVKILTLHICFSHQYDWSDQDQVELLEEFKYII